MPQLTAIATLALWKLKMPSARPAAERARPWTSETMPVAGLPLSNTSSIPGGDDHHDDDADHPVNDTRQQAPADREPLAPVRLRCRRDTATD
jgi:hypothetical protein